MVLKRNFISTYTTVWSECHNWIACKSKWIEYLRCSVTPYTCFKNHRPIRCYIICYAIQCTLKIQASNLIKLREKKMRNSMKIFTQIHAFAYRNWNYSSPIMLLKWHMGKSPRKIRFSQHFWSLSIGIRMQQTNQMPNITLVPILGSQNSSKLHLRLRAHFDCERKFEEKFQ